jgi:imidazolonepropionase-like amidohydrolase
MFCTLICCPAQTLQFKNGLWFNGKTFEPQTFYSVDGIFKTKIKGKPDSIIDLRRKYVLPPFADAHTHNLDGEYNLVNITNKYIDEGVMYVMVLANYIEGARANRKIFNRAGTLDVLYANGGLTCTLGHPFLSYEPNMMNLEQWWLKPELMDSIKKSRKAANDAYWFMDSKADVDAKWETYMQSNPDVVKIFLLDTEHHDELVKNDKAGDKGLSADVAAYIIEKAHLAGKRVAAHIETTYDFRLGLKLGVDIFAHMPEYGKDGKADLQSFSFTTEELETIKKHHVCMIPTISINEFFALTYEAKNNYEPILDSVRYNNVVAMQKKILGQLDKIGMPLLVGSDKFNGTMDIELEYWFKHQFFDPIKLLNIMCTVTPKNMFPNRKIGILKDGYEASFITLDKNPLEDWKAIQTVLMRYKQGKFVNYLNDSSKVKSTN